MKSLRKAAEGILVFLVASYAAINLFLLRDDFKLHMASLQQELANFRVTSLTDVPKRIDLSKVYFDVNNYCVETPNIFVRVKISNDGKMSFKTKIKNRNYKGPLPEGAEWWQDKKGLMMEISLSGVGTQRHKLNEVILDESGKMMSFKMNNILFSLAGCQ